MRQYPDDHGGLFDGANDLQGATTIRALLDVNVEDALEQPRPTHARRCAVCGGVFVVFCARPGTIAVRSLAWGASTPWKRIRCRRGRGTSAARRCMNSSGDITMCVVPSRLKLSAAKRWVKHSSQPSTDTSAGTGHHD